MRATCSRHEADAHEDLSEARRVLAPRERGEAVMLISHGALCPLVLRVRVPRSP